MREPQIELTIKGIALEKDQQMPVLILRELKGEKTFPIWIGPSEASSIIIEMEGVFPPRPLTHDLLAQFFLKHNFQLRSLEFYSVFEGKHLSRIRYSKGFRSHTMEVRPSDGVALAIRLGAPIYTTQELLDNQVIDLTSFEISPYSQEIIYLEQENFEKPLM